MNIPNEAATTNPPEQIHLSYHGKPQEMVVQWITQKNFDKKTTVPYVIYTTDLKNKPRAFGATEKWTDDGKSAISRFTHTVVLTDLIPGATYYYNAGSDEGMSKTFEFKAMPTEGKIRAAVFGDFSQVAPVTGYDALLNYTESNLLDIIFHIGDIAYDMDASNGKHGDDFMKWIEPIAARVPYMVVAGNHDGNQDFLHYKNRFSMPPNGYYDDNQFWSFDLGISHFVGLSSEYYFLDKSTEAKTQLTWLQADLQKNLKKPWTFYFIHRPMYCSGKKKTTCDEEEFTITRNGDSKFPGLETPLFVGGVDMGFWGHRHTYERFYPLYQDRTYVQKDANNFHDSPTPIYLMNGAGGPLDHEDTASLVPKPFSVTRLPDIGFIYLEIENETTVKTSFIPSISPFTPIDRFSLTKTAGYKPGQGK
ncbi:unnamed protein product, partial [Mesorhabditis belari]|uniref:Purple acid phosphatase n=1 Tax=Mesorhabditis belari TaxID=2138241 RepID=A0AAF3EW98_9BILA